VETVKDAVGEILIEQLALRREELQSEAHAPRLIAAAQPECVAGVRDLHRAAHETLVHRQVVDRPAPVLVEPVVLAVLAVRFQDAEHPGLDASRDPPGLLAVTQAGGATDGELLFRHQRGGGDADQGQHQHRDQQRGAGVTAAHVAALPLVALNHDA